MSKESPTNADRSSSGASSRPLEVRTLPSSAGRRITALVHEFVLQVFLPRGDFWDAVRDLRVRWNVSAETRVPPIDDADVYLPPECDQSVSSGLEGTEESNPAALKRWREDLGALHDRFVPSKCRTDARDSVSKENWERCLSAFVLYDPPETQLLEFADRVSLSPATLCPHCEGAGEVFQGSSFENEEFLEALSDMPFMVAPPIEYLRNPEEMEKAVDAHWWRAIDELAVRLEPRGLDIKAMVDDILQDERIQAEREKRAEKNLPKPYISVDELTTDEDARTARSMIAAVHGWDSKGGGSKRDRLKAVQCAILYDRHNFNLPEIAKRYGWSRDTARIYRNLGREILSAEKT